MSDYNKRLVLRAIRARSPVLHLGWVAYFLSIVYIIIYLLTNELTIGEAVGAFLRIHIWLVPVLIAEIPIILGRSDLNNDNLVHFRGTLLVDNGYNSTTYSEGIGIAWKINIDGRKQKVYQHYEVVSDKFTCLEEVEGVYLKHSKVILDMKRLRKY